MLNSLRRKKKAEERAREQLTHVLGNSVPRIVSGQILYLEAPTRKQYDQRNLVSFYVTATDLLGRKEVRDAMYHPRHMYAE